MTDESVVVRPTSRSGYNGSQAVVDQIRGTLISTRFQF
jgi:hypothetical protein